MNHSIRWYRPETVILPAFEKLFGVHQELERLLAAPFANLSRNSQLPSVWNPRIDIFENAENLVVTAELPGMKKEDIDVSLHEGELSISGERKREEKVDAQTHRSERFVGVFQRSITLPSQVKADAVKAHYQDGILTITLPKAEEAKRKQIEVKVN